MNLNVRINDFFSIVFVSILFTLMVCHLLIYNGRKGRDRLYYIYFVLFALNFTIYLSCETGLNKLIFKNPELKHAVSPIITGITYFLLLDFARRMLMIFLNFPESKLKYFRPYYYSFLIYGLLICTYLFYGYELYNKKIYPFVLVFATFSPAYMFAIFLVYIIKQKNTDVRQKFILIGFFIFMLGFAFEEIFSAFNFTYPFKGSYFISGFAVLLWAFTLAMRFNNEYKELQIIKQTLEMKFVGRNNELEYGNNQRSKEQISMSPHNLITESKFDYNCYLFNISVREKEIITFISEGYTYKEIADKLFISQNTVAKHLQNIYEKAGVKNKVELVRRMNG